jgi:methyl-accepting chemotaxis protein
VNNNIPTNGNKRWLTVGAKLLIGVALASNCFIGALLTINYQSTLHIEQMVAKVLAIREQVDVNLRDTIVKLQQEFTALPRLFQTDPKTALLAQVARDFQVQEQQQVSGREAYGAGFSRTEKRDLAKGLAVVQVENGNLMFSHGLVDAQGNFTDTVERLRLVSSHPDEDLLTLQKHVAAAYASQNGSSDLEQKIAALRKVAADKSIEAEKTRNEILGYVDEISAMEHEMASANRQQRRFSLSIGLATIIANVLVLFFLTRIIIEKPLHRLTAIVEALGAGQYPEVPWQERRDQIGVLSAGIRRFREVLLALKQEEGRKDEEQQIIETLVDTMTASIHHLDDQVRHMARMSLSLQDLAGITELESKNVAALASDTAVHTDEVAASSQQISSVVVDIHAQLGGQAVEVQHIVGEIGRVRQQLDGLKQSVFEINTIVAAVHVITDQTKILSINATIEAAKAGIHGRGFAVVADEMKKLSQDTAHATRDVLGKIETINATCQTFIDCFDSIDQGAHQLKQVTAAIGGAVDIQKDLTGAIVDLTTRTTENTQQVSTRIKAVNKAAGGVLQLSIDANRCADEIAALLDTLLRGPVHRLEALNRKRSDITRSREAVQETDFDKAPASLPNHALLPACRTIHPAIA